MLISCGFPVRQQPRKLGREDVAFSLPRCLFSGKADICFFAEKALSARKKQIMHEFSKNPRKIQQNPDCGNYATQAVFFLSTVFLQGRFSDRMGGISRAIFLQISGQFQTISVCSVRNKQRQKLAWALNVRKTASPRVTVCTYLGGNIFLRLQSHLSC